MLNKYLKILLKNREDRTMGELLVLNHFWRVANIQEFKLAYQIDAFINPKTA